MLRGKLFLISVAVLFQVASTSFALILDQAQDLVAQVPGLTGVGIGDAHSEWQEFKPTMNILEQVDFSLTGSNVPDGVIVSFEIRNGGSTLWSTSFAGNALPGTGWFELDTPPISLIPEQTYRLYLSRQVGSGGEIIWWGSEGDPYIRGISSPDDNPDTVLDTPFDFTFRTWAVPEPTTLLILGLGAVMLRRKH